MQKKSSEESPKSKYTVLFIDDFVRRECKQTDRHNKRGEVGHEEGGVQGITRLDGERIATTTKQTKVVLFGGFQLWHFHFRPRILQIYEYMTS